MSLIAFLSADELANDAVKCAANCSRNSKNGLRQFDALQCHFSGIPSGEVVRLFACFRNVSNGNGGLRPYTCKMYKFSNKFHFYFLNHRHLYHKSNPLISVRRDEFCNFWNAFSQNIFSSRPEKKSKEKFKKVRRRFE